VDAAVEVARRHGATVDEPVVIHDLFSVRVHLRPAPVVARVPTWVSRLRPSIGEGLAREVDVATHLLADGVPVVPPSAVLPPGPHTHDGLSLTFWEWVDVDSGPGAGATAAACVARLPRLHAGLARFPGSLPPLVPSIVDPERWLGMIDRDRLADRDERARLGAAVAGLGPVIDECSRPGVPLHGDAHPGNLLATGGRLLWTDLEEACSGPAEWDLATIGDGEAVRAGGTGADEARLEALTRLRLLQVALCLIVLRPEFTDVEGWSEGIAASLDGAVGPPVR
jgi:hypothetical protein